MTSTMNPTDEQLRCAAHVWVRDGRPDPEQWPHLPRPVREAMRTLGMNPRRAFIIDEDTSLPTQYITLNKAVSLVAEKVTFVMLLSMIFSGTTWQAMTLAGLSGGAVILFAHLTDRLIEARTATRRERARPWIEDAVETFSHDV